MKVWIMRGAPGAGKSWWISKNVPNEKIVSADYYFWKKGDYKTHFRKEDLPKAHDECLLEFVEALRQAAPWDAPDIVVDNTNTKVFEIAPYYRLAEAFGCEVEVVWVIAPPEVCKARNVHGVPPETVDQMMKGVEALPPWWKVRVVVNQEGACKP